MFIQNVLWDSKFFNINIGKIVCPTEESLDLNIFKDVLKMGKYDLIYVYKHNTPLNQKYIFDLKLDLIDVIVELSKEFNPQITQYNNQYKNKSYELKNELSEKELLDCYLIAEQTSSVSRFSKEPLISTNMTKQLYRKWVDNALNRSFADGIILEKINSSIVGINIIKTDIDNKTGYCSLIGVLNNVKRCGIGKKLWSQTLEYWNDKAIINKIIVPISLSNSESINFHLSQGFNRINNISYIYHYRKLK